MLKTYLIGWLLLAGSLTCWSAAAIYFEYSNHTFIVASFLQASGILLALACAYFFFERRSQVRQKRIEGNVERSIEHLENFAKYAVIDAVKQWKEHPYRHKMYCGQNKEIQYEDARKFVLDRSLLLTDYTSGIDSYGSLHWVFRRFEELAALCSQLFRIFGPGLMESRSVIEAMVDIENGVESERRVWEEFRMRMNGPNSPLPAEASYNVLAIATLAVQFIDVLDDRIEKSDYDSRRQFQPVVFWRSNQWGEWR